MQKYGFSFLLWMLMLLTVSLSCSKKPTSEVVGPSIEVRQDAANERVDITVDGKPFTSYLYTASIPNLKKTVLYPVYSPKGHAVTRGYPMDPKPGERADHPHHIGYWLNYGDVNGLDFWGNSAAMPPERAAQLGTIRHDAIHEMAGGTGSGELVVSENWLTPEEEVLLYEHSRFVFSAGDDWRAIDRITTLTAQDDSVYFNDTKEGMLAIRVRRELELPAEGGITIVNDQGEAERMEENDNAGVSGDYLNSNGITGYDVWGKRAKWTALSGVVDGEKVTLAIYDHPDNVGYPTYWHARGYGLFAANPLGQNTFSEGRETMNFSLAPGGSVTLKYRLMMFSGDTKTDEIEGGYQKYLQEQQ